ncbi:MAG: hypothetical protein Greene041619_876 [Candidatus Peregrinibacteria bacterium Greene0416_19]|nr:MAG: hypothetical protein Greene041619_876 [Candidatus Peregrinibacteria bacterium Greene0416_19]
MVTYNEMVKQARGMVEQQRSDELERRRGQQETNERLEREYFRKRSRVLEQLLADLGIPAPSEFGRVNGPKGGSPLVYLNGIELAIEIAGDTFSEYSGRHKIEHHTRDQDVLLLYCLAIGRETIPLPLTDDGKKTLLDYFVRKEAEMLAKK